MVLSSIALWYSCVLFWGSLSVGFINIIQLTMLCMCGVSICPF
uniref:Uncharacterized protein n=1 Tax=Anguilla anguilla TaxID=7936 RepID=A0A0E9VTJ2_ANGAN